MEIPRTPWQRYVAPAPVPAPEPAPPHGDPAWYANEAIPDAADVAWQDTGSRLIDHSAASVVAGCSGSVHFTYFQAFVTVAAGVGVDSFALTFADVDDGVRATVFHERDPGAGQVVPGSYVTLDDPKPRTVELGAALRPGVNRVVLTHEDDCPSASTLRLTAVVLTGAATPLAVEGLAFTGRRATALEVPVARVRARAAPEDLTATVSWGDGRPVTAGTVAGTPGSAYTVSGTHTYAEAGTYTVTTTVHDRDGPRDSGSGSATATVTTRPA